MAGSESVEKLEDGVVRSAEQVSGQIRAAKEAISTVIFGQDRVIENTLVTILSGGHALLIGRLRALPVELARERRCPECERDRRRDGDDRSHCRRERPPRAEGNDIRALGASIRQDPLAQLRRRRGRIHGIRER